jgi:hypothetical protein
LPATPFSLRNTVFLDTDPLLSFSVALTLTVAVVFTPVAFLRGVSFAARGPVVSWLAVSWLSVIESLTMADSLPAPSLNWA